MRRLQPIGPPSIADALRRTVDAISPAAPQGDAEAEQYAGSHQADADLDLLENSRRPAVTGECNNDGNDERDKADRSTAGHPNFLLDHGQFADSELGNLLAAAPRLSNGCDNSGHQHRRQGNTDDHQNNFGLHCAPFPVAAATYHPEKTEDTASKVESSDLISRMAADLRKADAFATEAGALRVLQSSRRYDVTDIVTLVDAARTRAAELVQADVTAAMAEPQR